MKLQYIAFSFLLILAAIFTIINIMEYFVVVDHERLLYENIINVPVDSHSYKLANKSKNIYIDSQVEALKKQKQFLIQLIFKVLFVFFAFFLFLNKNLRIKIYNLLDKKSNFRDKRYKDLKLSEINLLTLFIACNVIIKYIYIKIIYLFIITFLSYLILPYLIILFYRIFNIFKFRRIIFIAVFTFIMFLNSILISNVIIFYTKIFGVQVNTAIFSSELKKCIEKYNFQNSIYIVLKEMDFINALAMFNLIGKPIILVIGSIDLNHLESILCHEFGHIDDGLVNIIYLLKISSNILISICLIIIFNLSKKLIKNEKFSHFTIFMLLTIFCFTILNPWIGLIPNIFLQGREEYADNFTYQYGKNKVLAESFFRMACRFNVILYYSKLWGYLNYSHPSIFSRIENLNNL